MTVQRHLNSYECFHIGELSARTGRGIHAIRWYESQGLIPGGRRDGSGRRIYIEQHVSWLILIDRLRCTGMSVADMRKYVALVKRGSCTLEERRAFLSRHRGRVEAKIAELQGAVKLIDDKIDFYGEWLATGRQPKAPRLK